MMFVHIELRNIYGLLKGVFTGLIVISVILAVSLKSFRYGLISLIPNLVPGLIALGIWGVFVGQVGMGLSLVMGMTLGIVVDDTVHFLVKYLHAKNKLKYSAENAVRYAYKQCGAALVITTLVLFCGFLVLSLSSFTVSADMGLMTAITVVIALIIDFLLLPTLLIFLDSKDQLSVNKLASVDVAHDVLTSEKTNTGALL